MKKLLTIIFVLIILIAGGIGGGMYWFGMGLESSYRLALKQTGDLSGLILQGIGFDKNFLGADAQTLVMLPGLHVTGVVQQHITPGPIALSKLMAGQLDFNPVKYIADGTIKLNAKKGLASADRALIARLPTAALAVRSGLLTEKNTILITVPAFKGKTEGTSISWPQSEFLFETNENWSPIRLVSGSLNAKLPAGVVENLIRLRIHLDIEELKKRRKLSPAEVKQLSPAAVRISVANALPGYIERYGIKDVLDNAKNHGQPVNVSFRPGQIKVGGVTLPQ